MLSRRDKLLNRPWQELRYEAHRKKIEHAKPAIDDKSPKVYPHVTTKLKKAQCEKERLDRIRKENVRLLQKLGDIMKGKRLENIWIHPRPNFLNREKLFCTRPKTSDGRLESVDSVESTLKDISISSKQSLSVGRCSTCAGRPVKRNQVIPEERVPWEPPRKSWNRKIHTAEFQRHKCGDFCYV